MPRARRIGLLTYRLHQFEVIDDGGPGWGLILYAGRERQEIARLQTLAPAGLAALIADAQARVDCLIEASPATEAVVERRVM